MIFEFYIISDSILALRYWFGLLKYTESDYKGEGKGTTYVVYKDIWENIKLEVCEG